PPAIITRSLHDALPICLKEMRIRGIKTNLQFLTNVIGDESFRKGDYSTKFIDTTPSLFVFEKPKDRGTKTLEYISTITERFPRGDRKSTRLNSSHVSIS